MPAGHTFQVLDFTVTGDNYQNSGAGSHFGAMTQAFSNSNFDTDFDAKGAAIFAGSNGWCAAGANVMLQSWAIQNYNPTPPPGTPPCGTYLGCSTPVYGNQSPSTPPYTANRCATWNPATPKRFKVGSNIWQQSVYWMCQAGGACPGEFTSDVADSSTPYFRLGGAGVAFVHVANDLSIWSLSFTSVSSFTSP